MVATAPSGRGGPSGGARRRGRAASDVSPILVLAHRPLLPVVADVLARLDDRGHAMALASNKPARFSRMILDAKGVGSRFLAVGGPDAETPAKPDPAMLRRLMAAAGAEADETVVVGDMEVDAEFARAAGCRVVLIPSGSRSREELAGVDADALSERIGELPERVLWSSSSR